MSIFSKPYRAPLALLLTLTLLCSQLLYNVAPLQAAFTIKDEREYGQKMLAVIRSQFDLLDEPDISQYINSRGEDILKIAGNQYFQYHFYVIKDKEFNAFAAPSGLIFMHSGLLEAMDNEGELTSVLAHEVGHVTSRHIAGRLEQSTKISAATLAMLLAGIAVGGGALSQALITGGLATGQAMSMAFSRKDEEEADRKGYQYMLAMGYDPQTMVEMLHKMYQVQQLNIGKVPQYMLTHPNPDIRMGYVQDLIHTSPPTLLRQHDDFAFQRLKCRVRSYTKESLKLKALYQKKLRQAATPFNRAMARYGLALAYGDEAQWQQAEDELRQVIAFFPDKPILKTDLGVNFLRQGRVAEALVLLKEARDLDSNNWHTNYYLAQALESSGDDGRALSLFEQVSGAMPDFPGAYYHMAAILSRQGHAGPAYFYLGKNFFYQGKFSTARHHFAKAQKLIAADKVKMAEIREMRALMKEID
ncbi:MAG: M48 family metalloprotease [Thermodesulfobacteriota bacterium]